MKTSRLFVLITFAICAGFILARWSFAQSGAAPNKRPINGDSSPALEKLNALISYLKANQQTNALKLFEDYANANVAQQNSADIGVTLHVLMALREGRTNDAINLLDGKLDGDIIGFAASFKELPPADREWLGLHSLSDAQWYRNKYPYKHQYKEVDAGVAKAFELLENKSAP